MDEPIDTPPAERRLPGEPGRATSSGPTASIPPRATVLRHLWARGEISRAEVARLTGFSRSTVSGVVSELLDAGLAREIRQGTSSGGRKPIILGFVEDARVVIGLDIGASHVGVVLTDLRGRILRRASRWLPVREDPEGALGAAIEMGRGLRDAIDSPLLGVGLALPAPIDPRSGRPHARILPRWRGVDPVDVIEAAFQVPVRADNDANLGALAELWWGAGRGRRDLVFVKVATGIGAGIIIEGRIVAGAHGLAGELGHLSIDPNGPPCMCGGNGCLNVLVGTQALLERARARLVHFPGSDLRGRSLDLPALIEASRAGDELALEIVTFAGERLGEGLGNLLNVLDPGVIVVGGDLTEVGEPLLGPMRREVRRRTLAGGEAEDQVVVSQVDEQSVALGAATAILQAALESRELPLVGTEVGI